MTNPCCQFYNELEESVRYAIQQSPDFKYIVKEEVQRCGKVGQTARDHITEAQHLDPITHIV